MKTSLSAGMTTTYRYNGIGQRTSKTGPEVPTGAVEYVYNEEGHLLGEYDASGMALQKTVFLADMPVVVLTRSTSGAFAGHSVSVAYIYTDHLNAPRAITDAATNELVWSWLGADPFGVAQPMQNLRSRKMFVYNPRFPGQLYDQETNLHYNYYRDYDPQTGRYIQSDPIGLRGGANTYSYVGGNPIGRVDPLGLIDIYVGGAGDGTTKIVSSWVEKNARGSPYFEWTQGSELSEYISKVPANEPINLYGHS